MGVDPVLERSLIIIFNMGWRKFEISYLFSQNLNFLMLRRRFKSKQDLLKELIFYLDVKLFFYTKNKKFFLNFHKKYLFEILIIYLEILFFLKKITFSFSKEFLFNILFFYLLFFELLKSLYWIIIVTKVNSKNLKGKFNLFIFCKFFLKTFLLSSSLKNKKKFNSVPFISKFFKKLYFYF